MRIDSLLICIFLPILLSSWLTIISARRLRNNAMVNISKNALNIFFLFRLMYWIGFGILICAFLLAIIQSGANGEQTRMIIARSLKTGDRTASLLLSEMSVYFLPIIFASLFIAVIALAVIGRKVVTLLPNDGKPGQEFSRFRFTFVMMACSLIIPPLAFGSLLLI
jgi:hypothetical protein